MLILYGKPRQGVVYEILKQAWSKFKYALRVCKSKTNYIISEKIAESICAKNDRAFWREIKKIIQIVSSSCPMM